MIATLLFIVLLQDGPIATAPTEIEAQQGVDPGPACTFGGRPVSAPGCPPPPGRGRLVAPAASSLQARIEACARPEGRPSSETEFECASRARTDAWVRSFEPDGEQINREAGPAAAGFGDAAGADGEVPAWALADPARWEASQCAAGDDACRRQARNRLAMARAGVAARSPAADGPGAGGDRNCRMVMQRSETGFGGSLSRICSTGPGAETSLDRLNEVLRPTAEPCDRPAQQESQDAWIARCRALPPR